MAGKCLTDKHKQKRQVSISSSEKNAEQKALSSSSKKHSRSLPILSSANASTFLQEFQKQTPVSLSIFLFALTYPFLTYPCYQ